MKNNKGLNSQGNEQGNTYYQPGYVQRKPEEKSILPVIITVVVCVAIVTLVVIVGSFLFLNGTLHFATSSMLDEGYISGGADINAVGIDSLDIEWIEGKVDIVYYDGETISFTEIPEDTEHKLCYKVNGQTLHILEYDSETNTTGADFKSKRLLVKLPKDFALSQLDFDVVSADINVAGVCADVFSADTVSGDIIVSFASQPQSVDIDSVSGDAVISFPQDFSGYSLDIDTVSGKFSNTAMLDEGNRSTSIDFESVSGNLEFVKSK